MPHRPFNFVLKMKLKIYELTPDERSLIVSCLNFYGKNTTYHAGMLPFIKLIDAMLAVQNSYPHSSNLSRGSGHCRNPHVTELMLKLNKQLHDYTR